MRRWIAVGAGLIVAIVAITLALLGTLSHTSSGDVSFDAGSRVVVTTSTTTTATPTHTRSRATLPPAPTVPRRPATPAQAKLRTSLNKWLHAAGPHTGALVYDLTDHAGLFARHPGIGRSPASVEKLWTTATLLVRLGPQARLHTTLLGTGSKRHGVWHGDLYLRGGGDPTFGDPQFNRTWNAGQGSTATQLVDQLRRRGIHRVTGWVYADESMFDRRRGGLITHYLADIPDFGGQLASLTYDHGTTPTHYDPGTFAAHEFVLTARGAHISARASKHAERTPKRAHLLGVVDSPPLSVMLRRMNVPSDDLFAELFAKQLGELFGRGGTITAGARVISQTIASRYDLHPTILDGSGLGRADRTSPVEIVDLLRELWHTRVGHELSASLPTVGVDGTVKTIGLKTPAVKRCIAKTGTLNYVTNLVGYCHALGGHDLAFGLFVDGPANWTALALESKMVGAIAGY